MPARICTSALIIANSTNVQSKNRKVGNSFFNICAGRERSVATIFLGHTYQNSVRDVSSVSQMLVKCTFYRYSGSGFSFKNLKRHWGPGFLTSIAFIGI